MSNDRSELDEFAVAVRDYCREQLPEQTVARPGVVRDAQAAREHWRGLAVDLGAGSLLIDEEHGGSGATLVEAGRVAEALGAELAPLPFLSTGVLASTLLGEVARRAESQAAADLLGRIAEGAIVTVAWADTNPGEPVGGSLPSASYRYAIDADIADVVLLVGAGGKQIAAVDAANVDAVARPGFDLTRGLADVSVSTADLTMLASDDEAAAAFAAMLTAGRLALAAESAGGAGEALAVAVQYAHERVQFGREIGSFQSIKHMLADCFVNEQSALSVARQSIDGYVNGEPDAEELVAAASFYCADRFVDVAATGIQVHGGIGFTVERSAHLFRRRAEANRHLLGTPEQLRAEYLAVLKSKEVAA